MISFVRQSESRSKTFKELEEWAPPLSRRALCRHLAFVAKKGYLLKEKREGSFSKYRFNERFEKKFKRIDSVFDTWLAFSTLNKTKASLGRSFLDGVTPRKFRKTLSGLVKDRDALSLFETQFQAIGVEL